MIQINLSREQAKEFLNCLGWRVVAEGGNYDHMAIDKAVAHEMFVQLEHKLTPPPTEAANLATWRAEAGYTAQAIEEWKRKNETAEEAGL